MPNKLKELGDKLEYKYGTGDTLKLAFGTLKDILVDKNICTKEEFNIYFTKHVQSRLSELDEGDISDKFNK